MTLAQLKHEARAAGFARRKAAHGPGDHTSVLCKVLHGTRGEVISAYMPIGSEIDPLPMMHLMAADNRIVVPVMRGKGQPLVFHEWRPDAVMVAGPFGVCVPADGAQIEPTIVIAPLVAFDPQCFRLGYGGGFYDRTLEKLRSSGPLRVYGFAYGAQCAPSLPLEPTDQPLDAVVTEAGIVTPS
jgi:5-formyltetrahydrofolate cyclo-ligase